MSKGKVTKEEYEALLQRNLGRVNTDRDEAVRMTNEELGFGSSTALQFDVSDEKQPGAQPKGAA